MTVQLHKISFKYLGLFQSIQKLSCYRIVPNVFYTATSIHPFDTITMELLQRHKNKLRKQCIVANNVCVRYFVADEKPAFDISKMTDQELEDKLLEIMKSNKDKQFTEKIIECTNLHRDMTDIALKKMLRNYSILGRPDIIEILRQYCFKVNIKTYKRSGELKHFLAKAQCMKGNSEKGLSILRDCYEKNITLRSLYRLLFREMIQDTVLNRSEASMIIFKKFVIEFSEVYKDHYPLICFWHLCWCSSWFSDQMISNELLDDSEILRNILKDKAMEFSITALRHEYNEDAVFRLLQSLLKYHMMAEYVKVLQVLFDYKLKNRDLRGCKEILRNCEVLEVSLPSELRGRYIRMLIEGYSVDKPKTKNFTLKF